MITSKTRSEPKTGLGAKRKHTRAYVPDSALIKSASVKRDMLWVDLQDGRKLGAPLIWFPLLDASTPGQRAIYEIGGGGTSIYWPEIDEELSVSGLMAGINPRMS